MLRKIYLDGELGQKYGKELTMDVDSFADVFRCLQANYTDVKQYLADCHEKDIGFMCEIGTTSLETDLEFAINYPEGDLYISPQPAGAGKGLKKIITAIVVTYLAFKFGPLLFGEAGWMGTAGQSFGAWAKTGGGIVTLGIASNLVMTGIAEIMAPDPSTDRTIQDKDYLYQGSGQTIVEGDPVPVLYGRMRIPGRPISFSIRNTNQRFYNLSGTESSTGGSTTNDNGQNDDLNESTTSPDTGEVEGNVDTEQVVNELLGG